jgi:hypothetical protein
MDESCTEVFLDISKEDVKHLIGAEGANLKMITKKSNVYFMWYNAETHAMNIWGTKYHTEQAIKMVQKKCDKLKCKTDEPSLKKQKLT